MSEHQVMVAFQSRFGRTEWLKPYTSVVLQDLGKKGTRRVDVFCPGFVADCLETLEEIGQEVRDAFLQAGGQDFRYVPCLNDQPEWIAALTALVQRHLQGWDTGAAPDAAAGQLQCERARAMGAPD